MRGRIDFPFRGRIDEVRMYDYALVPSQIQNLAQRTVDPVGTGTIVITKLTSPAGASAAFPFSLGDGETETDFSLRDGESSTFENMPVGAYVAQEGALSGALDGFSLSDITCVEDGATNSVAEVQTQQALINLEADETVICTFTNHKIEVPLPGPQNAANLIPLVDSRIQSVSQWSIRMRRFYRLSRASTMARAPSLWLAQQSCWAPR